MINDITEKKSLRNPTNSAGNRAASVNVYSETKFKLYRHDPSDQRMLVNLRRYIRKVQQRNLISHVNIKYEDFSTMLRTCLMNDLQL